MTTEMSCSDESCYHDDIIVDFDAVVSKALYHSHEVGEGELPPVDLYNIVSPHTLPCDVVKIAFQRRNALGYSVLTQANAELASNTVSAEQHWERIAAKSPHYQRTPQQNSRAVVVREQTEGIINELVDPFPLLVTPRSSAFASRTMARLSMMTPPPTPPLWSRNKRRCDNDWNMDDDFGHAIHPLPSLPLKIENRTHQTGR